MTLAGDVRAGDMFSPQLLSDVRAILVVVLTRSVQVTLRASVYKKKGFPHQVHAGKSILSLITLLHAV